MNSKDRTSCIQRYDGRFPIFGVSPESLGWGGGKERQISRFRAAAEFSRFTNRTVKSVLDVGCGFGDLGAWLSQNNPEIEYSGIDINSSLVEKGRLQYQLNLAVKDISCIGDQSYDLVIANGIFNFRLLHEVHEDYIRNMLSRFMSIARVGIAVDFMSTYVDFQHPGAFHCPEALVVEVIKSRTKRYVIRNDYLDFEYMAYAFL